MLRIALGQINTTVGDLPGNSQRILQAVKLAAKNQANLAVFPELALCGYPPEDLLLKPHFIQANLKSIHALAQKIRGIAAIVGFVDSDASGKIYNAAAFISEGKIKGIYHKRELPNYGVFDEKRYFSVGTNTGILMCRG